MGLLQVGPHSSHVPYGAAIISAVVGHDAAKKELHMRSAITPGPEVTSAPLTFNLATRLHPTRIIELNLSSMWKMPIAISLWSSAGGLGNNFISIKSVHSCTLLQKSFFGCPWSLNGKVVILLCPQLTSPTIVRILIRGRKMFVYSVTTITPWLHWMQSTVGCLGTVVMN